jgi:flagellar hook assembly protein FlgD
VVLGIDDDDPGAVLPDGFELSQNYPNPFNPVTTIEYSVMRRGHVAIEIYNVLGQRVRTLVDETKSAGTYRVEWDGNDEAGRPVTSGVYLYRFTTGEVTETKKMLLVR